MKLKQAPEDFCVDEVTEVAPYGQGPFAFYRLEKKGWTTQDAMDLLCRRWRVPPREVCYAGLKDRHAHTVQFLTIYHGPRKNLDFKGVVVSYLGQVTERFTAQHIWGNRFRITLREVSPAEIPMALEALEEVSAYGVPNYFDDQRFGSLGSGKRLPALEMVLGRWEEALKLALASPYAYDRPEQKQTKAILRDHWGNWPECKKLLDRSHARSLVSYLVDHPLDFRGAVTRLRPELQGLYLSAYQSHVWNRCVARFLNSLCEPTRMVEIPLRMSPLPFPRSLTPAEMEKLSGAILPLPSARLKLVADDPWLPILNAVLAEDGIGIEDMKLKGVRKPFFARGERAVLCMPRAFTWQTGDDDRHPRKMKLQISFELPRGAYATLIVKRVQAHAARSPAAELDEEPVPASP